MTIQIPDNFMGKPIKGSIERVLASAIDQPQPSPLVSPQTAPSPAGNIANPQDYIILEGKTYGNYSYADSLIAMERTNFDKNWNDAHVSLIGEGARMPSIRQFVHFLNLLRSGRAYDGKGDLVDKRKLDSILEGIIAVRNPWRSEWLDAKFNVVNATLGVFGGTAKISYEHELVNSQLTPKRVEDLEECLMKKKTPGIDINDWLTNATYQGLPHKNVSDGALYYWAPTDGRVAGFYADSGRAGLDCYENPTVTLASLGVRAVRAKN